MADQPGLCRTLSETRKNRLSPEIYSADFVYCKIDLIRGWNNLYRVLTFAKPECNNVLQPDPRSGEGCNTLLHEGFANVNTRKILLFRHCYI